MSKEQPAHTHTREQQRAAHTRAHLVAEEGNLEGVAMGVLPDNLRQGAPACARLSRVAADARG
jgi:hypothetical protein